MIIKVNKCPYNEDEELYSYNRFNLKTGATILVGKNGTGKTTMLRFIEQAVNDKGNCKLLTFDNYTQGGSQSLSSALFHNKLDHLATLACSSEGQRINANLGEFIRNIGYTVRHSESGTKLVILMDAVDSGLSIDSVVTLKDVFDLIVEDAKENNIEVYIVASANGYELPNGMRCFSVKDGAYIKFDSYESYKTYILSQ